MGVLTLVRVMSPVAAVQTADKAVEGVLVWGEDDSTTVSNVQQLSDQFNVQVRRWFVHCCTPWQGVG